jgi:hypothetical protein
MPASLAVRLNNATKPSVDENQTVDLIGLVELLQDHVTEALCEEVFHEIRDKERQRAWSLHALAWFWMAVTLRAPKTLTEALDESRQGGDEAVPEVSATPEAFFEKCKDWRPDFFSELFVRVGPKFESEAAIVYAQHLADLRRHFPEIWVMDGSQLAEVAHRLKILWKVKGAVLPGRLMGFYDIFRGINRALAFDPDGARNENLLAKEALEHIPEGTLIIADRLYGVPGYFNELSKRKIWGVFRRNGMTKVEAVKVLSCKQDGQALVEDLLVRIGSGARGAARPLVRLIRYRAGKRKLDLFVNVMEAEKLSAEKAVELYRARWGIERMFYDLKEVLNLNRFYAANPNAVAMQVYAAALVYNAFRVIQGRIAQRHKIAPEWISPQKLFPKVAAVSAKLAYKEEAFLDIMASNPKAKLVKPSWRKGSFGQTRLDAILVRPKFNPRTPARHRPRSLWKSFRHIRCGKIFLRKLS